MNTSDAINAPDNDPQTEARTGRDVGEESVAPNSVGDRPAKTDQLGFGPYVSAVAAFLLHQDTKPPLTLSVEGEWGSGKSSFMLQLEEEIQKREEEIQKSEEENRKSKAKTVWFNAWRHKKDDELWADFALDFMRQLTKTLPPRKRWLYKAKLNLKRFDWRRGWPQVFKFLAFASLYGLVTIKLIRYFLGGNSFASLLASINITSSAHWEEIAIKALLGVGGTAGYALLFIATWRSLSQAIGGPVQFQLASYLRNPKYETRTAFIETFQSDFERLVKVYGEGRNVYVFVDDLDRCEVPRAADLMQAINLLISESVPVFYILGLDREKIAAGLAAKYEKLLPYLSGRSFAENTSGLAGIEFGYDFLEKFIQIPFLVPRPTEQDLDKFLGFPRKDAQEAARGKSADSTIDAGLLVELKSDSPRVQDAVKMVAPALDYNPRRVKQFLNLFRLRAILASRTGLFGPPRDSSKFDPLTLSQLAKLVALSLRWPLVLARLETQADLLGQLQRLAWRESEAEIRMENSPWATDQRLMKLLAFAGESAAPLQDPIAQKEYSLERVDLQRWLEVSPAVPSRLKHSEDEPADKPWEDRLHEPEISGQNATQVPSKTRRMKRGVRVKKR